LKVGDLRGLCVLLAKRADWIPSEAYMHFGFRSSSSASQAGTRTSKKLSSIPALQAIDKEVRTALEPRYRFKNGDPRQLAFF